MIESLYHNKFAPIYDLFQKGVKNDTKFYLDYFKNFHGSILEIGAGTGRITIPLLEHRLDITALDIAPKMLSLLKEKAKRKKLAVKTIRGDMKTFKLEKKFGAIIVTFRSFQHLYTVEDQMKALRNFKKHLKPRGILIFDVYAPNMKYMLQGNWQWRHDSVVSIPDMKGKTKIDFRNCYNLAEQIMYQEYRITYPNGKKAILPLRMRFFFRFEIEHLLRLAGFRIVALYGDFKKGKVRENGSAEMVWVAQKF